MAQEIELKILLDEEQDRRIRAGSALRNLRGGGRPATKQLVSVYYDTPGHDLKAQKIALRLRKVGRAWVQTVKRSSRAMAGGLSTPEESEAPAPGGRIDLGLVGEADLRGAVEAAIGDQPLAPVFETRMKRTQHVLQLPQGRVELAIDTGEVVAGGQSEPLREVEFELLEGDPSALFTAARALFPEGPVRFSEASKAARGYALAAGDPVVPKPKPRNARRVAITADMPVEAAARDILSECLDQIAANICTVSASDDPEGPHQLRIGLRRFRTALAALKPVIGGPVLERLGATAQGLGASVGRLRDLDVMRTDMLAPLGGGSDAKALDDALAAQVTAVRAAVRTELAGPEATAFLFDFGACIAGRGWLDRGDYEQTARLLRPAGEVLGAALDKRWKRACKLGKRIAELDIETRHELRKELKKLRYTSEFTEGFWDEKQTKKFLKALKRLQTAFGALNDLAMCETMLTGPAAPAPDDAMAQRAAGRVLGWYGHASDAAWEHAQEWWQTLHEIGPFWK